MSTRTDGKLQRLVAAGLHPAASSRDIVDLGRLGDLASVSGGTVLRREGGHEPWTYCVLDGHALLSEGGRPVAVAGPGAWLVGHLPGQPPAGSLVQVVAAADVELLAFRPGDAEQALRALRLAG